MTLMDRDTYSSGLLLPFCKFVIPEKENLHDNQLLSYVIECSRLQMIKSCIFERCF